MKTRLTIEESQELIKLGVPVGMASRHFAIADSPVATGIPNVYHRVDSKSVFILTDLLDILPKEIEVDKVTLSLVIERQGDKWYACYMGQGYMKADYYAPELKASR